MTAAVSTNIVDIKAVLQLLKIKNPQEEIIKKYLEKFFTYVSDQVLLQNVIEARNTYATIPNHRWKIIADTINSLRSQEGLPEISSLKIAEYFKEKLVKIKSEHKNGLGKKKYEKINWTVERATVMLDVVNRYRNNSTRNRLSKEDWLKIREQLIEKDRSFEKIPLIGINEIKSLRDAFTRAQKVFNERTG